MIRKHLKKIKDHIKKNKNQHIDHEEFDMPIYEWIAPEYHKHERGLIWLIGIVAFFTALVIYSVKTGSWTMSLATILLAAVYYIAHKDPVRNIKIKISKAGFKINNHIYPFSDIEKFWVVYQPPFVKTLNIRLHRKHNSDITIQLADSDHEIIRHILNSYLPEWEGKGESLTEVFARAFKI